MIDTNNKYHHFITDIFLFYGIYCTTFVFVLRIDRLLAISNYFVNRDNNQKIIYLFICQIFKFKVILIHSDLFNVKPSHHQV